MNAFALLAQSGLESTGWLMNWWTSWYGCGTGLITYAVVAWSLMVIAQKTGHTDNAWWAWIPVLNGLLAVKIAGRPLWWLILLLIPCIDLVFIAIVLMDIATKRGKPAVLGILGLIPCVQLVVFPYLAFSD
jgi:hypothetical protein